MGSPQQFLRDNMAYSDAYSERIEDKTIIYKVGDSISLLLVLDEVTVTAIGDTVDIQIVDPYNTVIGTVTASKIAPDLYAAEYVIPRNLSKLYDPLKQETSTDGYYTLSDKWNFPDGSSLTYSFNVSRDEAEQPVTPNCEIRVAVTGIKAEDGTSTDAEAKFMTSLEPFYGSIQDVVDISPEEFASIDPFVIAREIQEASTVVDLHMRPDRIYNQERYEFAVRGYVKYHAAYHLLSPRLTISSEEKQIDLFKISRTSNNTQYLKEVQTDRDEFAVKVYAGGRDRLPTSSIFQKGIYDPNRPNFGRANLDNFGWYPWTNTTTSSVVIEIDGNAMEVRGARSISFAHVFNSLNAFDRGDVGYLARI